MNPCVASLALILRFLLFSISNPSKDLECSEKFDHEFTRLRAKPCDDTFEARYCIKATGMFEGQVGTKRLCSSRDLGDFCDYVSRPGDERHYRSCVYTCASDECNHSWSVTSSHTLPPLLAFTTIAIVYRNLILYFNH